ISNFVEISYCDFGQDARSLKIEGNYAYIAACHGGLQVIDISNPYNPLEVASVPSGSGYPTEDILLSNGIVFLATGNKSIQKIDITTPTTPVAMGAYLEAHETPRKLYLYADHIYVCTDKGTMQIIDIEDARNPKIVGQLGGWAGDLEGFDNFLYEACGDSGLKILDISSPDKPEEVNRLGLLDKVNHISIIGKTAFVGAWKDSAMGMLYILDLTNPDAPSMISSLEFESAPQDICVHDGYALVCLGYDGITILKIRDLNEPERLKDLNHQAVIVDVVLNGNFAYTTGWMGGMRVIDIIDPTNPRIIASIAEASGLNIRIDEDIASIPNIPKGIKLLDVSTPDSPYLLSYIEEPRVIQCYVIEDDRLYAVDRDYGLWIYDISQPSQPILIAKHPLYFASEIKVDKNIACIVEVDTFRVEVLSYPKSSEVLQSESRVHVYDLKNIDNPELLSVFPASGIISFTNNIVISGNLDQLMVWDIEDLLQPKRVYLKNTIRLTFYKDRNISKIHSYVEMLNMIHEASDATGVDLKRILGNPYRPGGIEFRDGFAYCAGNTNLSIYRVEIQHEK
ncbi:hypothetical protein KKA00_09720, partial [bacterium]|nr:hypothetical protein [bacterium]